jgi:hypothetical protein
MRSVRNLIGKKFTDEVAIFHRWNLSVGKTVKSYSVVVCDNLTFKKLFKAEEDQVFR